jgi:subtilisin family serine protease
MSFNPWPRPKSALLGLLLVALGIGSVQPALAALPASSGGDSFGQATVTADYVRAMESLGYHQLASDEFAVRQTSQGAHTGQQRQVSFQLRNGQQLTLTTDQTVQAQVLEGSNGPTFVAADPQTTIMRYAGLDNPADKVGQSLELQAAQSGGPIPVIIRFALPFGRFYEPSDSGASRAAKAQQFASARAAVASLVGARGKVKRDLLIINGVSADLTPAALADLERSPLVQKVEADVPVKADLDTSSLDIHDQDVWPLVGANNQPLTGVGETIAVIDTGVDYHQPAFGSCASVGPGCKVIGGYNFVSNTADPMDDQGHGTHVAATAAGKDPLIVPATGKPLWGVAPDATIRAYKVLDANGSGYSSAIISGIQQAVTDGAQVGTMSLGGSGNPDDAMSTAVDNATVAGMVFTIAAGNSGPSPSTIMSPGTSRTAITVAAACKSADVGTNSYCTNPIASFSSRGPLIWNGIDLQKPDVAAPGFNICAARWSTAFPTAPTCFDSQHIRLAGTSMATPHVAGATALLRQAHPEYSPAQVKQVLKSTATSLGNETYNDEGAGELNARAAIPTNSQFTIQPPTGSFATSPTSQLSTSSASFTVTPASGSGITSVTVQPNLSAIGIAVSLSKTTLSFPTSTSSDSFTVTVTVDNNVAAAGTSTGYFALVDGIGVARGYIFVTIDVKATIAVSTTSLDLGVDNPSLTSWTSGAQSVTVTNLRADVGQTIATTASTFATGITLQTTPATLSLPAGGSGSFAATFVVDNTQVANGIYNGGLNVGSGVSSTVTTSVPIAVRFVKYYEVTFQDSNTGDFTNAWGYLSGPQGQIFLPSGVAPKVAYVPVVGTYYGVILYPQLTDSTGAVHQYEVHKPNLQVSATQPLVTVNVSRGDASNAVQIYATDASGTTYSALATMSRTTGKPFSILTIAACLGSCDMSLNYLSNIPSTTQEEEVYGVPSFQPAPNQYFFYVPLTGLSGNLTVANNASDFPPPTQFRLTQDTQSGTIQPLFQSVWQGLGATFTAGNVLNLPVTQNLYSLLPTDGQHFIYHIASGGSASQPTVQSPDVAQSSPLSRTWDPLGRLFLPPATENVVYDGLGPSFWDMKLTPQSSTSFLLYAYYNAAVGAGHDDAFVRQDYAYKAFAPVPFTMYQNGVAVYSSSFSYGYMGRYGVSLAQAGPTEMRVDSFPYEDAGQSLQAQVKLDFDTTLADASPPAIKRLYYYAGNLRSEVYDPTVLNRLELELDPVGGVLTTVQLEYATDGTTFLSLPVSTPSNGVYTASLPTRSGLSVLTLRLTAGDDSGNTLAYTFQLPDGSASAPPTPTSTSTAIVPTATSTPTSTSTSTFAPTSTPTSTLTPTRTPKGHQGGATATPTPTFTPTVAATATPVSGSGSGPTVSITNPTNGGTVRRNSTVTISANATSSVGVSRVDFLVNGTLLCSAASSPYSCGWKVPTKSGVTYTVAAEAFDVQGATSSQSIAVTAQ